MNVGKLHIQQFALRGSQSHFAIGQPYKLRLDFKLFVGRIPKTRSVGLSLRDVGEEKNGDADHSTDDFAVHVSLSRGWEFRKAQVKTSTRTCRI